MFLLFTFHLKNIINFENRLALIKLFRMCYIMNTFEPPVVEVAASVLVRNGCSLFLTTVNIECRNLISLSWAMYYYLVKSLINPTNNNNIQYKTNFYKLQVDMCFYNMIQSPFIKWMRESFKVSDSHGLFN